jgi:hypothetical protein
VELLACCFGAGGLLADFTGEAACGADLTFLLTLLLAEVDDVACFFCSLWSGSALVFSKGTGASKELDRFLFVSKVTDWL